MAVYWILIIPLLVLAYYGKYIHVKKFSSTAVSKTVLAFSSMILLYIAFMLVNNNSLMEQPEHWSAYFSHRNGTLLNFANPALWPRYLHFIAASVAIGGLVFALIFKLRKAGQGNESQMNRGLIIFAVATLFQILIGFWYLLAIPSEFIKNFMGGDLVSTLFLMLGIFCGLAAMITGFLKKFTPTVILILITMLSMIINRLNLRMMYLADNFQLSTLELSPQYGVLVVFLLVLVVGLAAVVYMLRAAFCKTEGRVNS